MNSMTLTVVMVLSLGVAVPIVMKDRSGAGDQHLANVKSETETSKRSGTATAYRDRNGHFEFNASMNGSNVRVLVDTGASAVAINRTTARRIGIKVRDSDFRHPANTANGKINVASATIKKLRIGGVSMRNVKAMVLDDQALNNTLLGMSFLNRLKTFQFEGNRLKLVQ
ncbi:MAG: TIGR02281 family clan AA aspartic protease [Pseudomonadota bacterium]